MSNRFKCLKPEATNEKEDTYRPTNRFLRKNPLKKNSRWKRDDEPAKQDSLPVNSRWNFTSTSPKNDNAFKRTDEKNDRFSENNSEDNNSFRRSNLGRRNYRNSRGYRRHRDGNDGPRIRGRVIGQLDLGLALQKRPQKRQKSPNKNEKNDNKKIEVASKKLLPFKKKNNDVSLTLSKDDKKLILAQYALCYESEDEQFSDTE